IADVSDPAAPTEVECSSYDPIMVVPVGDVSDGETGIHFVEIAEQANKTGRVVLVAIDECAGDQAAIVYGVGKGKRGAGHIDERELVIAAKHSKVRTIERVAPRVTRQSPGIIDPP